MIVKEVDKRTSDYLKGIGILMIMLHNYFHILQNAPSENEFTFSSQATFNLLHNLATSPFDSVKQLFSFFGHYAVQLFVFLSGYGLAIKYGSVTGIKYGEFIIRRVSRFYPVFLFAVLFLLIYKLAIVTISPGTEIDLTAFAQQAAFKLTLLSNLIPGQALTVSSPWWFFSLLFQLYLAAPFLLKFQNKNYLLGVMAAAWAVQLIAVIFAPQYTSFLRFNIIGHLPEFCLGMYFARQGRITITSKLLLIIGALNIAGYFYDAFWVIAFSTVPVLFLILGRLSTPVQQSRFYKLMLFFGRNSLYFFAVHGLLRAPFVALGNQSVAGSLAGAVLYMLLVVLVAMAFKFLVKQITFSLIWFRPSNEVPKA